MIDVPRGKYIGERVGESSRATRANDLRADENPNGICRNIFALQNAVSGSTKITRQTP